MQKTADSIRDYGVLVPGLVRPRPEGGYEIIAGHRRKRASEIAGKKTMPVLIRNMDDDEATIAMVDSNLQREFILHSERAAAYQMKLEALAHQGKRNDLTSSQVGTKLRADAIIAEEAGTSRNQVQRYIRLNNLIKPILNLVDTEKIAFTPAVELSYLKPDEQKKLLETMEAAQATPSLSQAMRMKKLSQEGELSLENMAQILSEEKKPPKKIEDRPPPNPMLPEDEAGIIKPGLSGDVPARQADRRLFRTYVEILSNQCAAPLFPDRHPGTENHHRAAAQIPDRLPENQQLRKVHGGQHPPQHFQFFLLAGGRGSYTQKPRPPHP